MLKINWIKRSNNNQLEIKNEENRYEDAIKS